MQAYLDRLHGHPLPREIDVKTQVLLDQGFAAILISHEVLKVAATRSCVNRREGERDLGKQHSRIGGCYMHHTYVLSISATCSWRAFQAGVDAIESDMVGMSICAPSKKLEVTPPVIEAQACRVIT
jgi:hypothetical protein